MNWSKMNWSTMTGNAWKWETLKWMTDAEMKGMEWGNVNSNETKLREMNGMIRKDRK